MLSATLALGLTAAAQAAAAGTELAALEQAAVSQDLTLLSLEDLMRIEVTSVSKRSEPLMDAAAAISVLTGEEIRRAGARNLAEALRLIPGVNVAASSAQSYAIGIRGFNSTSSDKLEVLVDGRSVYTPLFSGVFWDALDTYLPDIDRIEVIRGPGAALWGANAVNGVINIVTKPADETLGTRLDAAAGTQELGYIGGRSGSRVGERGALRLYGQAREIDRSERADGSDAQDGMRFRQFGFRGDYKGERDGLTLSGDFHDGSIRSVTIQQQPATSDLLGAHLLANWTRNDIAGGRLSTQMSYAHSDRRQPTVFAEVRDTLDIDVQHDRVWGERHHLTYGLSYRDSQDRTGAFPDYVIFFAPAERRLQTYGVFAQDQIALAEALTLTLGSKFEYNDFTGFEFQPNVRAGWRLSPRLFTWAAISRAVRTPNRLDSDIAIYCPPPDGFPPVCGPGAFRIGNPDLESEKVHSLDWGLRAGLSEHMTVDLALFYNRYTELRSTETDRPFGRFANELDGHGYGSELIFNWQLLDTLRLQASYAFLELDIDASGRSTDTTTPATWEGSDPHHRARLRATWQPLPAWSLDGFLRYVGRLDAYDVPAYTELNLRAAWRPRPELEFALAGSDLLDDRHPEFGRNTATSFRSEVERAVRLTVGWEWR
ncbi:TonB-dependent receptor [Fontimonas sp. SYSU GA230001]